MEEINSEELHMYFELLESTTSHSKEHYPSATDFVKEAKIAATVSPTAKLEIS